MSMNNKLKWCRNQKNGITLIEPNDNLAEEYYKNAEETLKMTRQTKDSAPNMWLATHKYYTEYFAAYSLLMKLGIKSEIHSCTIEIIRSLEEHELINFKPSETLESDKQLRIDNQYYLKNKPVNIDFQKLSDLLLDIRHTLDNLKSEDIKKIRALFQE